MMRNLSFRVIFRQFFCLLCLLALSGASLNATRLTNFRYYPAISSDPRSDDNWWIVDNTKKIPGVGPGILGSFVPGVNDFDNVFQLTDTFMTQSIAMWNKHEIDLTKDFELRFKLYFGTGKIDYGWPADGFVIAFHNIDTFNLLTTIGHGECGLGFGGNCGVIYDTVNGYQCIYPTNVTPGLGVEFDTEYNDHFEKFGNRYDMTGLWNNHISFLYGGWVSPMDTIRPMQDGDARATVGQWFCARITWTCIETAQDTTYNMKVFFAERDGTFKLRTQHTFSDLDNFIPGLEPDSTGSAWVGWGVTAATCNAPNKQMIEFVSLTNDYDLGNQNATTGKVESEIILQREACDPNSNSYIPNPIQCYPASDTLYRYYGECNVDYPTESMNSSDTMVFDINCDFFSGTGCCYDLIFDAFGREFSQKEWYVNGNFTPVIVYDYLSEDSAGRWHFSLSEILPYIKNNDVSDITLELIPPQYGADPIYYTFKFNVNSNERFAKLLGQGIVVDSSNTSGILEVAGNVSRLEIPLPYDCGKYSINTDSIKLNHLPEIADENTLIVYLDSNFCSVDIPLAFECPCQSEFTLTVKNKNCRKGEDCDGVEISNGEIIGSPNPNIADISELLALQKADRDYAFSMLWYGSNKKVVNVEAGWPKGTMEDGKPIYQVTANNSGGGHIVFMFPCFIEFMGKVIKLHPFSPPVLPINSGIVQLDTMINKFSHIGPAYSVDVCLTFEDSSVCCKTVKLKYRCWNRHVISRLDLFPIPVTNQITIDYELLPEAFELQLPLKIDIYDQFGNHRQNIKNSVPTSIGETIQANISELNAGAYYILFEIGEYIEGMDFIKE